MNKVTRRLGTLLLAGAAAMTLVGCGSNAKGGDGEDKIGQLALPLVTQGASGVTYRLRDATFAIHTGYYYDYGYPVAAGTGGTASGGTGAGGDDVLTVSSEDDPSSSTISLSLEEGQYYIELLPGWHFEKDAPGGPVEVEATLLTGETQWVWVSRQSTSFAEYQFGLGGRELWLNGQLNIGVVLHEDPQELNGGGSGGGYIGTGGGYYYGEAGAGYDAGGTGSTP
jgi:hypothetical protein